MKKCAIALFSALFLVSGARGSESFTSDGVSPQQRQQIEQQVKAKQEALRQAMLKKQQEERQKQLLKKQQEEQKQAAIKKALAEKLKQEAQKQAALKKQQEEQKQAAIKKALAEKAKQEALKQAALKKQHEQKVAQKQQKQGQQAQQVGQFVKKLKKVRKAVMKQLVATKLVIRKTGSVGQFAQKVRQSLKGVDENIVAFAKDQGIDLESLNVSGRSRAFEAMSSLSGTALERAWVKAVHDRHVKLIAHLEQFREDADGSQKALIDVLLPALKANAQEAAKLLASFRD